MSISAQCFHVLTQRIYATLQMPAVLPCTALCSVHQRPGNASFPWRCKSPAMHDLQSSSTYTSPCDFHANRRQHSGPVRTCSLLQRRQSFGLKFLWFFFSYSQSTVRGRRPGEANAGRWIWEPHAQLDDKTISFFSTGGLRDKLRTTEVLGLPRGR